MFAVSSCQGQGNPISIIPKKNSLTGASKNLKKLFKSVPRIFGKRKSSKDVEITNVLQTCATEEEHQNWLNEQLASKIAPL